MTTVRETAPAKINLYLHVGPIRDDGLHDLASLFVFTERGDEVFAEESDRLSLEITGPFAGALSNDAPTDNLVYRAAAALRDQYVVSAGAKLRLVKNLPVTAGVGGGSADAAAALRALEKLWGLAVSPAEMRALAFKLGADIPACLERAPVLVDGAGEKLSPGPKLPPAHVLLVNPGVEMPTGPVFRRFDVDNPAAPAPSHPNAVASAIDDLQALMTASRNDLEPAAMAIAPEIAELLDAMRAAPGAVAARMSGSGATCFALFNDAETAAASAKDFQKKNYWAMVSPIASR